MEVVNWTHTIAAYRFGVPKLYAPTGNVQFTLVNWTHTIVAYRFGVRNLYALTGAVQFTLVTWTHTIAAYRFGVSKLYAPIRAVQFTLVNWTPHIAAYRFGIPKLYAPTGAVQFTLVNWTHTIAAYRFGVSKLYAADCNQSSKILQTVLPTFNSAVFLRMASSNEIPGGLIHSTRANPALSNCSRSLIRPAMRQTGVLPDLARIPTGSLPISVCRSAEPSPVMTKSASRTSASK